MSHRYRLAPTAGQTAGMRVHCGQARFVWNLALEHAEMHSSFGRFADQMAWDRMLAELRGSLDWLAAGSSSVQQGALRDIRRAYRNWWSNPGHFGRPTKRSWRGVNGFVIRDLTVQRISRRWASVHVPKVGPVRFRWSRPLPEDARSARVTVDRAGRWHVSFGSIPVRVTGPGDGTIVGVDRGVVVGFQCSDGRRLIVPTLRQAERVRLLRLQRRHARQVKGSRRRGATKCSIARLRARETDRRKDAIEKATTDLARTSDVVRLEDLHVVGMVRSARGTIDEPGSKVRQKAGLNRSIHAQGWGLFARRLSDKIGVRLELVPAAHTSQRCAACGHVARENRLSQAGFRCVACGHTANADANAAVNIAAGRAVSGRGGNGAVRPPGEASTTLPGVGTSRARREGTLVGTRPGGRQSDSPESYDEITEEWTTDA